MIGRYLVEKVENTRQPKGDYTKRYLPELKQLPDKYLFRPWEAPPEVLKKATITLGQTYPFPMVNVKESRHRALEAYSITKEF